MKPIRTLMAHPEGSLMNPATRYTTAAGTDLRARFARERKALGLPTPKRAPQRRGLAAGAGRAGVMKAHHKDVALLLPEHVTLDWLAAQCSEEAECWIWNGRTTSNGCLRRFIFFFSCSTA